MSDLKNNYLVTGERYGKYEAIPFDKIKTEDYIPAIDWALEKARKEFQEYLNNPETPNFKNTFAVEYGVELDYIADIYFNMLGTIGTPEFSALAGEMSQKLTEYSNETSMNPKLFERIKYVYDHQAEEDLTAEEKRMVKLTYEGFIRNGALLPDDKKAELMKINMELSQIGPKYNQNILNSTNKFELIIEDENELEGLPENAKAMAANIAKAKGHEGKWLFILQPSVFIPVLKYCKNRELREKFSKAWKCRAYKDEFDNQENVLQIVKLRQMRANLLGFDTHSDITLEGRMAPNTEAVLDFLENIRQISYPVAKKEMEEIKAVAKEDGIDEMMPWDQAYYSNILKQRKYNFDSEELRPYFKADNVVKGIFAVANKLYGLTFTEESDIPVYHEEVKVFSVRDEAADRYMGLIYVDLFPRPIKRSGAWMTNFIPQGLQKGEIKRPHVSITASLTPASEDRPALLSLDEVTTIFHEFGHSLHGLLSDVKYTSLASPNVFWDFVELPSQVMENWVLEKETLELFAYHYETNELIPEELVQKVRDSHYFMQGSAYLRQYQLAHLDMAWHAQDPSKVGDVVKFEDEVLKESQLFDVKVDGNTSCSFSHIFAGGYSAGYYSYKWAEALDADAFSKFKEDGIFNKETAKSFRDNILSKGNTEEPMTLYERFRGRKPDNNAMFKRDGLLK